MSKDDDSPDEAAARLTANLPALAQALPALLEQFRELARSLQRDNVAGKIVDVAEEQRLQAFVQLVKALTQDREPPAEAHDVQRLVDATLAVARAELTRHARLTKIYAPAPPVIATERQLLQLFLDLMMYVSGKIDEGEGQQLMLRIGTTDAGWALVELEPSRGIDGEAADAQLAGARAIVQELGGRMRIARERGRAPSLRVELPPARAPETDIRA
jgi:hypothetical protein